MALRALAAAAAAALVSSSAGSRSSVPATALEVALGTSPGSCPAGVNTGCGDGSVGTCCPVLYSNSGYGCCPLPDAVCCGTGTQNCCPSGSTCHVLGPYNSVCEVNGVNVSSTQVCEPGAQFPANASALPAVIAIGDSVSIGYTPIVASLLNSTAFVQHSPWSGGGGADDVGNGVRCEEFFLRTAMFEEQTWPVISFNFGLHNLDNSSSAEETYTELLTNFTDALVANARPKGTKLLYVTTTPFMKDRWYGNMVVEQLNAIAVPIMNARGIQVADLYTHVTNFCGARYNVCSLCDDEWDNVTDIYCGYHYSPAGWEYLGEFLAPIYQALLGK